MDSLPRQQGDKLGSGKPKPSRSATRSSRLSSRALGGGGMTPRSLAFYRAYLTLSRLRMNNTCISINSPRYESHVPCRISAKTAVGCLFVLLTKDGEPLWRVRFPLLANKSRGRRGRRGF